uniref:Uncharacterized protein n=1 Tax=Ditylenchus dipsaci TaxID=166011 RepID=A0A915CW13_9BILA
MGRSSLCQFTLCPANCAKIKSNMRNIFKFVLVHDRNKERHSRQRMTGMKKATSLSEWQLQAVLYKAKLTQYYETFISQGGDDIDQIMQCDEQEFLEIMSLVGMSQKPLHVRRLQRTLNEFSLNRAQFLMTSVNFVGFPPMDFPSSTSPIEGLTSALQFLIPGFMPNQLDLSALMASSQLDETLVASTSKGSVVSPSPPSSTIKAIPSSSSGSNSVVGGTANIILPFPDSVLMSLVSSGCQVTPPPIIHGSTSVDSCSPMKGVDTRPAVDTLSPVQKTNAQTHSEIANDFGLVASSSSSMSSAAAMDPSSMIYQLFEIPSLCDTDIRQLAETQASAQQKENQQRVVRRNVVAIEHPRRLIEFRRFSAIYGRFDAKRKADKPLTFHEALVNEAAAQLCICRPELLTRRDELFPLARKLVRSAGFRGLRGMSRRHLSRRRNRKRSGMVGEEAAYDSTERSSERSQSPEHSSVGSTSPSPSPQVGGHASATEGLENGDIFRPNSVESTSSTNHKATMEQRAIRLEECFERSQLQAPIKKRRQQNQQQQSPNTTRIQE